MTRKDYVSIASVLLNNKGNIDDNAFTALIKDLSDMLYRDNNRFNRDRFERACLGVK